MNHLPDDLSVTSNQIHQTHLGIRSLYFTLALNVFQDVARCSSVIVLLPAPVNSLLRTICRAIATTATAYHNCIVSTENNETQGSKIVRQNATRAKEKKSGTPPGRAYGMGVGNHTTFYIDADFFWMIHLL